MLAHNGELPGLGREALFPAAPQDTTLKEVDQQILKDGEDIIFAVPPPRDPKLVMQDCLAHKCQGSAPP